MRTLALALALCPVTSTAQEMDAMASLSRATELANILASEQLCELTLDEAGLERWIAANVAKDDMAFASNLQMMMAGQAYQQDGMTAATRTAHCAAVRQAARTAGLIK